MWPVQELSQLEKAFWGSWDSSDSRLLSPDLVGRQYECIQKWALDVQMVDATTFRGGDDKINLHSLNTRNGSVQLQTH